MAGEQDILSLGLNIDSFNAQKKKVLREYIDIFDSLSKYDGKIFNPVLGDGLTQFNKSIQETSKSINDINSKLSSLNTSLSKNSQSSNSASSSTKNLTSAKSASSSAIIKNTKDVDDNTKKIASQITEYDRLVKKVKELEAAYKSSVLSTGKKSAQSISLASEFNAANAELTKVEKTFNKTTNAASTFGKMLSENLSGLRNIAYILPGIGLAGIFNLAYEAVGALIVELGILGESEEDIIRKNELLAKSYELLEKTIKSASEASRYLYADSEIDGLERVLSLLKATGIEKGVTLNQSVINAKRALDLDIIGQNGGKLANGESSIALLNQQIKKDAELLDASFQRVLNIKSQGIGNIYVENLSEKAFKKALEESEKELEERQKNYDASKKALIDYNTAVSNLANARAELAKFNADQERKNIVETAKSNLSVIIQKNRDILSNERSTEEERKKSILRIKEQENILAKINNFNITSNNSSTPKEINTANVVLKNEKLKNELDYNEKLDKIQTEFYQRYIKSLTDLSKLEIEAEAVKNERIYKNDEKTLEERLLAYSKYISSRQYIQDKEFERDIQKGAKEKGGKTSLTKEEQDEIKGNRDNQKAIIQADIEKQVYDIVYSSLRKQLKAVIDANFLQEEENKKAYAKELNDLNKSFEEKLISYRKYKKERERIDKTYTRSGYDEAIEDDKKDIKRLEELLEKERQMLKKAEEEKESAAIGLDYTKKSGDGNLGDAQEGYDRSVGEVNSINDAIIEAEKELQKAKEKLDDDELKRAKLKYDQLIAYQKEYAANNKAIIEALYNFIKTAVDADYERKVEAEQLKRDTFNESYENEIDAVERSSLSSKDKAALDIQLQTQKDEANKRSVKEERKLKHDQAVADRALNVAHTLWNTQEAVSAALTIPPPAGEIIAAQRGILGAIQVATILATNIPSYEFGTEDHPGGFARYAEKGKPEMIVEPGKKPYVALNETISYLPPHTQVIPLINNSPVFESKNKDESWMQTRFLAKQIAKSNKDVKNVIHNTVKIDLGFENYKRTILGN